MLLSVILLYFHQAVTHQELLETYIYHIKIMMLQKQHLMKWKNKTQNHYLLMVTCQTSTRCHSMKRIQEWFISNRKLKLVDNFQTIADRDSQIFLFTSSQVTMKIDLKDTLELRHQNYQTWMNSDQMYFYMQLNMVYSIYHLDLKLSLVTS